MKRIITLLLTLSFFTTAVYSQNKEGQRVLEKIRKEMLDKERAEEKAKLDAKDAEERARKAEERKGQEELKKARRELNEPIEERVFQNQGNKDEALKAGFQNAKKRLDFINLEEEEIRKFEKALGIKEVKTGILSGEEFDKVYKEYLSEASAIDKLKFENKKLNQYLDRLNNIEAELKKQI